MGYVVFCLNAILYIRFQNVKNVKEKKQEWFKEGNLKINLFEMYICLTFLFSSSRFCKYGKCGLDFVGEQIKSANDWNEWN